jgi:glycosyltransferase involved in cell wall biosynthesis
MVGPKYSVIIPTLNEENFLPKLLDSLAVQPNQDLFEVVVIDGNSKDKTITIANFYKSRIKNFRVFTSQKASLPLQRNVGAKETHGEWLVFIDADSVLMPYFFERIHAFVSISTSDLLTSWFQPDSQEVKDAISILIGNIMIEGSILFHRPLPPGPLTIVRRKVFDSVGGYDEAHAFHEDMDLGLRLFHTGVTLDVVRETLFVMSLRRFRKEGTLKVVQQYIISSLPVLFFNKTFKNMPGYIMGGQIYDKQKKKLKISKIKIYQNKIKTIMNQMFE